LISFWSDEAVFTKGTLFLLSVKDMGLNKFFAFNLLGFLSLLCSCATPQVKPPDSHNNFTFDVTVVNYTLFDLEIMDESRIIPRQGEKTIALPSYFGELNDGYSVTYRIPLLGDLILEIPRDENIIIGNNQRTALIDSPDFQSDLCFLVLKNTGNQTVSLKDSNAYLNSVVGFDPKEYSSSLYIGPGNSGLYELKPGQNNLSIETDQYRTITFPLNFAVTGFIYTFIFDGAEAFLIDARPLVEIGQNTKVAVEFEGFPLSQQDKQIITDGLRNAFQTWKIPLKPDIVSSAGYLFSIAIDVTHLPPTPFFNETLLEAVVELSLFINGSLICETPVPRITDIGEPLLILQIAEQLKREQDFFLRINKTIKP
jgi:hypothetical protein